MSLKSIGLEGFRKWGKLIAVFAVGGAVLLSVKLVKAQPAPLVLHGATIAKGCESPKQPGQTVNCSIAVGYNDQGGDTISIDEVWDIQDYGGDNVRVPAVGSLDIAAVSGNTTCTVGGALPCLIGPAGSTLSGLPGTGLAGVVTFSSGAYTVLADDPNPLPDQGNARVHDLCDSPTTDGCNTAPNVIQFTSQTTVVTPTPTPTNTPTPTPSPTNTPTPTPTVTNTPTPTVTNTPTPTVTPTPTPVVLGCTLTQGYWKNHANNWPVASLMLGSVNYTKAELLSILKQPVKGNGLVSLAHQLIAAKLNIATGASAPVSVQNAIAQADALINSKVVPPVGNGSLTTAQVSSLVTTLDNFNTGLIGPGHCSNGPVLVTPTVAPTTPPTLTPTPDFN